MRNYISALVCAALLLALPVAGVAESRTASAKGFGGDVTVTVTIEDGRITDVAA